MLFLAVIVGAFLMALMARVPFFGPIIAGFIAGLIARGGGRGLLAGFISGIIVALLAIIGVTGAGIWLGSLMFGPAGAAAGGAVAAVIAGGILILGAYFGLLGLCGGFLGGLISRR
jgi:hypothetical protein